MKNLVLLALSLAFSVAGFSQKLFTKTGRIDFYSKAPLEDIQATNKTVTAVIERKSGGVQFSVPMRGFEFEKKLMQEHFNENYVESTKYPKSEFKGSITNTSEINYDKDGSYNAKVKGKLTMHGVTRDVESAGTITVSGGKAQVNASFNVLMSDYKVSIPSLVKDKVSNSVRIVVDCKLEPLKS